MFSELDSELLGARGLVVWHALLDVRVFIFRRAHLYVSSRIMF